MQVRRNLAIIFVLYMLFCYCESVKTIKRSFKRIKCHDGKLNDSSKQIGCSTCLLIDTEQEQSIR